ncbi:MAG: hypothetical protein EOO39_16280 [Cytophagaceae bacterium]|nr:MAG: hypothetical protein EOO39_16280 [Cytophagaceae bacterium]
MKLLLPFLTLACCIACSRPPATFNNPYGVTAMLNDSAWFGRAYAAEAAALNDKPCAVGRFTVFLATDRNYPGGELRLSPEVVAMQAGEFVPRQRLTFSNIPAKKGFHHVSELNQCGGISVEQGNFLLLGNGSGIMDAYFLKPSKSNQVRIVKIDSATRTITGSFKLTLANPTGRTAHFRNGWFVAKWPKK